MIGLSRVDVRAGSFDARFTELAVAVRAVAPGIELRANANRRLLISLRWRSCGRGRLSVHPGLLDHGEAVAELPRWVLDQGRGAFPGIRHALRAVGDRLMSSSLPAPAGPALDPITTPLDLKALHLRIHASWFAHLLPVEIAWAPRRARRGQMHIRFACYRADPVARISVNRCLDQAWVARVFVEHVIFHELCHHAQACRPQRGEAMHGERFRAWERRYPHHQAAMEWERAHLCHFLDQTIPPSIPPEQRNT